MSRKPRIPSSTGIYHIVIRGTDRQVIFDEENDYRKYLEILEEYKEECKFELFAYCLMSNHVHLLLRVGEMPLPFIFLRINTSYAVWFNMKYQRTGYLQQGRYHSEPVENMRYLATVICYIHHNPKLAGLESACGTSYKWSSYHAYKRKKPGLVDTDFVINTVFGWDGFWEMHQNYTVSKITPLDIHNIPRRVPDDVACEIICNITGCSNVVEFQKLPLEERKQYIFELHYRGLSVRQINRLTGTPRGSIERAIRKQMMISDEKG